TRPAFRLKAETTEKLSRAHQHFDRQLIEPLVPKTSRTESHAIERLRLQRLAFLGGVLLATPVGLVGLRELGEDSLDLRIRVPFLRPLRQQLVGPHAPAGERLHALDVFGAIGVRIEVAAALVADVLEELDDEEALLQAVGAEAKVLIVAAERLVVEIDVEQLAGVPRLRDRVEEVEARHVLVRDLGIHADHPGVRERRDEAEHRAGGRQVDVASRLVRLRLEREPVVVLLVARVLAEEVDGVPHALHRVERVLGRVRLRPFPAAPHHVDARAELVAEIHRPHRLLQRVGADLRVVRRERAVLERRIGEKIRRRHRNEEAGLVQRLLEVPDDLIPLGRRRGNRHEIVVVEVDPHRAHFRQQVHDPDGRHRLTHRLAERIAAGIADRPEAEGERVLGHAVSSRVVLWRVSTLRYAAAACQTDLANPLDRAAMRANTDRMLAMVDAAVAGSAPFLPVRLIVFPEFAHAAPVFPTVGELQDKIAVPVPNEHTERLALKAREHGVYIQSGSMIEADPRWPGAVFNTTCLVGPEGLLSKYRKVNPWIPYEVHSSPHDLEGYDEPLFPVADTPIGKIGCAICYD